MNTRPMTLQNVKTGERYYHVKTGQTYYWDPAQAKYIPLASKPLTLRSIVARVALFQGLLWLAVSCVLQWFWDTLPITERWLALVFIGTQLFVPVILGIALVVYRKEGT